MQSAALGGWKNPGGAAQALADWNDYLRTLPRKELRAAADEWSAFLVSHDESLE